MWLKNLFSKLREWWEANEKPPLREVIVYERPHDDEDDGEGHFDD